MSFDPADCPDNAEKMLEGGYCLASLSKNVKKGDLQKPNPKHYSCKEPECETLVTAQTMVLDLSTQRGCDDKLARLLDGRVVVEELVHAFNVDPSGRGFHSGRFQWESKAGVAVGELSGMTNAGLFRKPAFDACEKCLTTRIDLGRFCGAVEKAEAKEFEGARLFGVYRLRFSRASGNGFVGNVTGTWEGVVVRPCRG
ncbi:MAG TPA: hypothetical protein VJT75_11680 [Thermoleophilaceae bacterium]|nr:hypothetical protein [Thermoleophilaceae bacterium]